MNVSAIPWSGIHTENFEGTIRFLTGMFGFPPQHLDEEMPLAQFKFTGGHVFEVLSRLNYPRRSRQVIAFEVADVIQARQELSEYGLDLVTKIMSAENETWCYFSGPDEHIYELVQHEGEDSAPVTESIFSGYAFVRAPAADIETAAAFFTNVLGFPRIRSSKTDHVVYRLPSGQFFELCGPNNAYTWEHEAIIVGFSTRDIQAAYKTLKAQGVEIVDDIARHSSGEAWFYFRGPEDIIFSVSAQPV